MYLKSLIPPSLPSYPYLKSLAGDSGVVTEDDEDELDELVGVDEELEDELEELVGLDDDELDEDELDDELDEELAEEELDDDDELDDELLDCSEEELADEDELSELLETSEDVLEDELSELLDFSEVLDELTELLVVSVGVEVFAPSLHAVKVKTIAAATIALKIFLIFITFFLSTNFYLPTKVYYILHNLSSICTKKSAPRSALSYSILLQIRAHFVLEHDN